jgi:hypothetical protein
VTIARVAPGTPRAVADGMIESGALGRAHDPGVYDGRAVAMSHDGSVALIADGDVVRFGDGPDADRGTPTRALALLDGETWVVVEDRGEHLLRRFDTAGESWSRSGSLALTDLVRHPIHRWLHPQRGPPGRLRRSGRGTPLLTANLESAVRGVSRPGRGLGHRCHHHTTSIRMRYAEKRMLTAGDIQRRIDADASLTMSRSLVNSILLDK